MNIIHDDLTYNVTSFTVYSLDKKTWVLQTTKSISIIDNIILINVLNKIKDHKHITLSRLIHIINNDILSSKIISYLKDNGIIRPLKNLNFNLKSSILITNNNNILDFFRSHFFKQTVLLDQVDEQEFKSNQLIVAVLNPYNPKMVRKLYKKFENTHSYLLVGFIYNFKFYLDNIYNSELEFPDHFDHLKYIQSGIYSDQTNYTYQDLVNIIFEKDPNFNLEFFLSWIDVVMISKILLQRLIEIFDLDNNVNLYLNDIIVKIEELDLKTYKVIADSANYWEVG